MIFNKLHKIVFLTTLIFAVTGGIFAQADISSPYSRFGLGNISKNKSNTIIQGMGGISNAVDGKYLLNNANPASYAEMDSLTFLFDAGFYMKYVTYRNSTDAEKGSDASFDYFDLGFGVTKWLKMGLGVAPFSNRSYSSSAEYDFQYPYTIDYEGTGGLNKLYWVSGFKIYKGLSLGVKLNYVFGNITDVTTLYYPGLNNFHNEKRTINLHFSDVTFDFGLIYKQKLRNDYTLTFGATYSMPTKLNAHQNVFIYTMFKGYGTYTETLCDTIVYKNNEKTEVKYPQSFGAGITLQKNDRWLIGIDFNWGNWEQFKIDNVSDSLQNSWNVAIGGCYTPYNTSVSNYLRKVTYRAGMHYEQTYFNIYGTSINKYGVTLGLGLPIPRAMTSINVAVDFGKMGTTQNNLIEESYFNISFGVSIRDKWFVKRRYK